MSFSYIIKYIKSISDIAETDGYVELNKNNTLPSITIRSLDKILLHKIITKNFAEVHFDDNNLLCTIHYKDYKDDCFYTSSLLFDDNSSCAYSDFQKHFMELYNTATETEYYPNGRPMYVGDILYKIDANNVTTRIPNGNGIWFYDLPDYKLKYSGEFEDGLYDGAGIFYTPDNNISLDVKNISAGLPTQVCTVNIPSYDAIEINFNTIWEKLLITDKQAKKNFVMTDNFVYIAAKIAWDIKYNNTISFDEVMFQYKSLDEKYIELWKLLKSNRMELQVLNHHLKHNVIQIIHNNKYIVMLSCLLVTFLCFAFACVYTHL
jgi:hypothetical protein